LIVRLLHVAASPSVAPAAAQAKDHIAPEGSPRFQAPVPKTPASLTAMSGVTGVKVLEFESIASGDPELATMAARHGRNIWHRRVWNHDPP
jgi:hypothetical protein